MHLYVHPMGNIKQSLECYVGAKSLLLGLTLVAQHIGLIVLCKLRMLAAGVLLHYRVLWGTIKCLEPAKDY